MPRRPPIPDLAGRAAAAYRAIQNESRLACLRYLLTVPSATRPEVSSATGLTATTTMGALRELEELGFVTASRPPQQHGPRPRYQAHRDVVTSDLLTLVSWVLG